MMNTARTVETTATAADRTTVRKTRAKDHSERAPWFMRMHLWALSGVSRHIAAMIVRAVVMLLDLLLVAMTAMSIIPSVAMYLHRELLGPALLAGGVSPEGLLALWVMPMLFIVIMLAALEIVAIRVLWRWSMRLLQWHTARAIVHAPAPTAPSTSKSTPTRTARTAKNRKK